MSEKSRAMDLMEESKQMVALTAGGLSKREETLFGTIYNLALIDAKALRAEQAKQKEAENKTLIEKLIEHGGNSREWCPSMIGLEHPKCDETDCPECWEKALKNLLNGGGEIE